MKSSPVHSRGTHTDGLHRSKEGSHSTTDMGLDNKRTARTLLEFCGIFIIFFYYFCGVLFFFNTG